MVSINYECKKQFFLTKNILKKNVPKEETKVAKGAITNPNLLSPPQKKTLTTNHMLILGQVM